MTGFWVLVGVGVVRFVRFTGCDGVVVDRVRLELPGGVLDPPRFLLFGGRLFEYGGSGLGGELSTNFYREVVSFLDVSDCV